MRAVWAWRVQRMPWLRFGPLALFLALAASPESPRAVHLPLAWLLVAAFRLRDDLADRATDPPDRVLVAAPSPAPFHRAFLLALLAGAAGATAVSGAVGGALVLGCAAAFEGLYRADVGGRHRWVLAKYPVLVAALGSRDPAVLGMVYLSFAVFERIDDPVLAARSPARLLPWLLLALPPAALAGAGGVVAWAVTAVVALLGAWRRLRWTAPAVFVLSLVLWGTSHLEPVSWTVSPRRSLREAGAAPQRVQSKVSGSGGESPCEEKRSTC